MPRKVKIAAIFARKVEIGAIFGPPRGGVGVRGPSTLKSRINPV